jgi:hypothetical protein
MIRYAKNGLLCEIKKTFPRRIVELLLKKRRSGPDRELGNI